MAVGIPMPPSSPYHALLPVLLACCCPQGHVCSGPWSCSPPKHGKLSHSPGGESPTAAPNSPLLVQSPSDAPPGAQQR